MGAEKSSNGFAKVHNAIGFKKGFNFILWFVFAGALFGFTLARLQYLSINGKFREGSAPGEWYWENHGFRKIGITLHLATILPAGILVVFQFIPIIRYKALLFHRINGYVIILLLLLANVGALMIARHAFGGTMATQVYVGLLAIMTTLGVLLAYYNIKRLQIDQHRAWMLRTWFYAGSIVTLRIIMIISALIISSSNDYYSAIPCTEIAFVYNNLSLLEANYPQCLTNGTTDGWVAVKADFGDNVGVKTALNLTFGTAGWLALFLHAVGVEIYLQLTPRESERLRTVSYQRQLEAGFRHPGSSGISVDRWGDADAWKPSS
ncbi:MAG: hypothetical protein Q9191_000729 [Dirinaria sp. TL-2023a]